jgi:SAM-dependent methyltransferase
VSRLDPEATLRTAEIDVSARARPLALDEALPYLRSPDSGRPLRLDEKRGELFAGEEAFPITDGSPLLLPRKAIDYLDRVATTGARTPPTDSFEQYIFMHLVRQDSGIQNSPPTDVSYLQHIYRCRALLADWRGAVLDIGCDDPATSRAFFPEGVRHLGLEPSRNDARDFRVIGMAEFLPVASEVFDGAAFLGSLDHVLDYQTAIDEAHRVLKPGGRLLVSSLAWFERAALHTDGFHFHHFRLGQLQAALERFVIDDVVQLPWKFDDHRAEVFLRARKPQPA